MAHVGLLHPVSANIYGIQRRLHLSEVGGAAFHRCSQKSMKHLWNTVPSASVGGRALYSIDGCRNL